MEAKKNKGLVYFKPGINKKFFISIIIMAVIIGLIGILSRPLGVNNSIVAVMAVLFALSSVQNDYTDKIGINTLEIFAMQMISGAVSVFAMHNVAIQAVSFFAITFFAVYILSNDRFKPFYLLYIIIFIMMCYYPVSGSGIIARFIILAASSLLFMVFQMIIHRRGFIKKINAGLKSNIDGFKETLSSVVEEDKYEEIHTEWNQKILGGLDAITGKYDTIEGLKAFEKQVKAYSLLQVINNVVYELRKNNNNINYENISSNLDNLSTYLKGDYDEDTLVDDIAKEFSRYGLNLKKYFKENEREYLEEISDKNSHYRSVLKRERLLGALKVSILMAATVVVLGFVDVVYEFLYPLYLAVLVHPYSEVTRKGYKNRLLNTVYALGLFFASFYITDQFIVHVILFVVFTLVADMFLHFDFMTVMVTVIPTVLVTITGSMPIPEMALARVLSVLIPVGIYLILDYVLLPRRISNSFKLLISRSTQLNNELSKIVSSNNISYESVEKILEEKQDIRATLKTLNSYVNNERIKEYIALENRISQRLILMSFEEKISLIDSDNYNKMILDRLLNGLNESNRMSISINNMFNTRKEEESYAK